MRGLEIRPKSDIKILNCCSASFMSKMFVADEQVYKFQIWDTAGQERVRLL